MSDDDAMLRICEEIEQTVWVIDHKFFADNPKRSYWVRPALPIEISQVELGSGNPLPVPPGAIAVTAIRQLVPGVRVRTVIVIGDPPGPLPDLPEDTCRDWYLRFGGEEVDGFLNKGQKQ